MDVGGWVAGVGEEYVFTRSLALHLGQRTPDGARVVTSIGAAGVETEFVPEASVAPSLSIPADAARALYDALAAHFGNTSDARQLRRDYDAERGRVDKMIGHLIDRTQQ